eukprot:5221465-Lingulodinium_polyedra.AAC.1
MTSGGRPTTWLSGTRCAGGLSMKTSLVADVAGGLWAASLRAGAAEACVAACVAAGGVGPRTTGLPAGLPLA